MDVLLLLNLDAAGAEPLHRQLYQQIRVAILSGQLRSHQKLPASRQLAKALGISRTTVVQGYEQLLSEGYLHSRPGSGTFVCAELPDRLLAANPAAAAFLQVSGDQRETPSSIPDYALSGYPLFGYGDRLRGMADFRYGEDCALSFRYGLPAFEHFPRSLWRRLLSQGIEKTDWMSYAQEPLGYLPLREQIADYLCQVRAVRCQSDQILITNGTQQALTLIAQVLINPGEAVAFENPGYASGRQIFQASGAAILPVAVDAEGLQMEGAQGLEAIAREFEARADGQRFGELGEGAAVRLVYVTPSHQFPTGVLMSLRRRLALLAWAEQNRAWIVEDDYDSEFRYRGSPIPALQGLDGGDRVLYVGTFSKILFPGLRIGYVALPPALVSLFRRAKWLCDRQSSYLEQIALAAFIGQGHLARHIRRMGKRYASRRQALVNALSMLSGGEVRILGDEAGLHVMAKIPLSMSNQALVDKARVAGVSLFSAQPSYWPTANSSNPPIDPSGEDFQKYFKAARGGREGHGEFIFGFGAIKAEEIPLAINRISPFLA